MLLSMLCRWTALEVTQRSDGMDDHLGEAGRKGAPVRQSESLEHQTGLCWARK